MWDILEKYSGYMGSTNDYNEASLVIVGAPMDATVTFRPGARLGPQRIRQVSEGLEEFSPYLKRDLKNFKYYDAGDVILPPGNIKESLSRIGRAVEYILDHGKFPLVLGGEHLISLPVIKTVARFFPDLVIIHFDAHADLRDEYMEQKLSHATVMRRVVELVGGTNVFQLGVRSGTREEFSFARVNTNLFFEETILPLEKILNSITGKPVYVTLDIDVVDPAYAPGTGTPEPGGCSSREIIKAIHCLGQVQVVGMDLVEVSPAYDPSERTSLLAAKLVREAILCFSG